MNNKIADLRKEKKISQTDLADAVFVSRQTITSIEIGKYNASLELAYKIAKYFDLTIEEVFDFNEIEVNKNVLSHQKESMVPTIKERLLG
jgi:putative transcriptional regulator